MASRSGIFTSERMGLNNKIDQNLKSRPRRGWVICSVCLPISVCSCGAGDCDDIMARAWNACHRHPRDKCQLSESHQATYEVTLSHPIFSCCNPALLRDTSHVWNEFVLPSSRILYQTDYLDDGLSNHESIMPTFSLVPRLISEARSNSSDRQLNSRNSREV